MTLDRSLFCFSLDQLMLKLLELNANSAADNFLFSYVETRYFFEIFHSLNNNNVHLSCAHQRPERSHDTY